ncbi:MAG: CehA/McbA family metallohydrolase [bacterium]|jgi:hypothetical protein
MPFYKGSLHVHTTYSDGEGSISQIASVYDELSYDFIYVTDHNVVVPVDEVIQQGNVLILPGCEVTLTIEESGEAKTYLHVNGLDVREITIPEPKQSVVETLQLAVDSIRAAGGIAQLNHPSWNWAYNAEDMKQVRGWHMVEIANKHIGAHIKGGGGIPSTEQMWDDVLSSGMRVWGTATDDAHTISCPNWHEYVYNPLPGKAWVGVQAPEKSPKAIKEALLNGNFYSSTGVDLDEIKITDTLISLNIHRKWDRLYTTSFIGQDGEILLIDTTLSPSYTIKGTETYIRARIEDSAGFYAWTQPHWVK